MGTQPTHQQPDQHLQQLRKLLSTPTTEAPVRSYDQRKPNLHASRQRNTAGDAA